MDRTLTRKITWRLVPFLVLIYLVAYIDRSNVGIAKLTMQHDIALSEAAYGLGAGLFFIGYFLFEVPSNLLLNRYGARRWFARIMVTWGVVVVLTSLAQGTSSFYVLRFLLGAAEAGLMPGLIYYLSRWFTNRDRARIVGLLMFGNPAATVIGAPLSGLLLKLDGVLGLHGWQWMFLTTGLPAVILAFVVLKVLPDTPAQARWLTPQERTAVENAVRATDAGATEHRNPLRALADKRVLFLCAFWFAFPVATLGLQLWIPTIIKNFGATDTMAAVLTAIPYLCVMVGLWWVPRRSARTGELYWHMAIPALLGAVAFVLIGTTHSPVLQMVYISFAAVGLMAGQPILLSLPGKVLSGAAMAVGIACVNSVGNLGGFVGPYVVGLITESTGSTTYAMYFLAAWLVYAAGMALAARRLFGTTRTPEATSEPANA